jgi:hypothetical protein
MHERALVSMKWAISHTAPMRRTCSSRRQRASPADNLLDEQIQGVDRVLERGRLTRPDGPSVRTLHLDEAMKEDSDQDADLVRISGTHKTAASGGRVPTCVIIATVRAPSAACGRQRLSPPRC